MLALLRGSLHISGSRFSITLTEPENRETMRSPHRRLAAIARLALATFVALAIATPASAQFGGLKKKIKPAAQPANNTEAAGPGNQGGTIVLNEEVVDRLMVGLKAGQGERQAAAKEDTPYGRYTRAEAAYAEAKVKCEAGQEAFYQRAATDEKMLDKYGALTDKMVAAQGKGDMKLQAIYQDSAMAMIDPSCIVKKPDQPADYYQAQRDIDVRAERLEIKASGFSAHEMAVVKERTLSLLGAAPPLGDASAGEKSAVAGKSVELKPLLGIKEKPAAVVQKPEPEPEPEPEPASAPGDPQMSAAASSMNDCMVKNIQKSQTRLEALGQRAKAAQKAGDQQKLMAIADTLQQIQMAGCR